MLWKLNLSQASFVSSNYANPQYTDGDYFGHLGDSVPELVSLTDEERKKLTPD